MRPVRIAVLPERRQHRGRVHGLDAAVSRSGRIACEQGRHHFVPVRAGEVGGVRRTGWAGQTPAGAPLRFADEKALAVHRTGDDIYFWFVSAPVTLGRFPGAETTLRARAALVRSERPSEAAREASAPGRATRRHRGPARGDGRRGRDRGTRIPDGRYSAAAPNRVIHLSAGSNGPAREDRCRRAGFRFLHKGEALPPRPTPILAFMDDRPAAETPTVESPSETGTPGAGESKRLRAPGRDDGTRRTSRVHAAGEPGSDPDRPGRPGADPDLVEDLRRIGERCARVLGPGSSSEEIGDFLYDERGLPK